MKEIGEKLRQTRESIGITIDEVAQDLKIRASQIEKIEQGNRDSFKDVFYLKMFIKNYAKYLGLDEEALLEEFNDYLFDFTSKINLDDIKKAEKDKIKKEKKIKTVKISSPYTVMKNQQKSVPRFLIIGGVIMLIIIIIYTIMLLISNKEKEETNTIMKEGFDINELA